MIKYDTQHKRLYIVSEGLSVLSGVCILCLKVWVYYQVWYRTVRVVPKRAQERDYSRIYYGGDGGLMQEHRERLQRVRVQSIYEWGTNDQQE